MSSQPFAPIDLSVRMEAEPLRLLLLGKTGTGKSSFGNALVGGSVFSVDDSASSGTSRCQAEGNDEIKVIDTPGFFDTNMEDEKFRSEIIKSIIESSPGPHALLIVLKVEKYTKQEQEVITEIEKFFSEEPFKHAVLVFTHGDQLDEKKTILQFVSENKALKDLSDKCGGRCHVVDNKYWKKNQEDPERNNQVQIRRLINTIREMVEINGGECYTNEMLEEVERRIREEEERTGSREEAMEIVTERIHENTRGIGGKGLWRAFLGKLRWIIAFLSACFGVAATGEGEIVGGVAEGPGGLAAGAAAGAEIGASARAAVGASIAAGFARKVVVASRRCPEGYESLKQTDEDDEVNIAETTHDSVNTQRRSKVD